MTGIVALLVVVLGIWMTACAFYGFKARLGRFLMILALGLGANALWMVFGLNARLTEFHALVALVSATVYGACAFALGWVVGRLSRRWRSSAVDSGQV